MCILKIKKEPLPSYFSIYQNTVIYNYIWLNTVKDLSQTSSCITINVCCKWYNKHTCYQKNHRFMCNVIQSNITVYLQNNSVQTGFHSKKNHYRFITSSIPVGILQMHCLMVINYLCLWSSCRNCFSCRNRFCISCCQRTKSSTFTSFALNKTSK